MERVERVVGRVRRDGRPKTEPGHVVVVHEAQRLEKEKEKEEGDDAMATDEEASPWD